jgi:hypothetical protein
MGIAALSPSYELTPGFEQRLASESAQLVEEGQLRQLRPAE